MDFYEMENRLSLCGVYRFFDRNRNMDELPVDKKTGIGKEVEWFRQETERFGQFYQQVTDLYFTGLQVVTIDPGQVQADSLKEGVVICLPTTPLDSLEGAAFKYTLSRL